MNKFQKFNILIEYHTKFLCNYFKAYIYIVIIWRPIQKFYFNFFMINPFIIEKIIFFLDFCLNN